MLKMDIIFSCGRIGLKNQIVNLKNEERLRIVSLLFYEQLKTLRLS